MLGVCFHSARLPDPWSGAAIADDDEQLAKYQEIVSVMTENSMVKGITTWGYLEGATYSANAMLLRANGTERPAMTWLQKHYAELGR